MPFCSLTRSLGKNEGSPSQLAWVSIKTRAGGTAGLSLFELNSIFSKPSVIFVQWCIFMKQRLLRTEHLFSDSVDEETTAQRSPSERRLCRRGLIKKKYLYQGCLSPRKCQEVLICNILQGSPGHLPQLRRGKSLVLSRPGSVTWWWYQPCWLDPIRQCPHLGLLNILAHTAGGKCSEW